MYTRISYGVVFMYYLDIYFVFIFYYFLVRNLIFDVQVLNQTSSSLENDVKIILNMII